MNRLPVPRSALLTLGLASILFLASAGRASASDALRQRVFQAGSQPVTAGSSSSSSAASRAAAAQAAQASQNARDVMMRTAQAMDAVRAMQAAARATAAAQAATNLGLNPRTGVQLPNVPNGLQAGGLEIIRVVNGAQAPVETTSGSDVNVSVKQTAQQALLHWKTFNVGRDTTLHFDQTSGGADSSRWIAYNKIFDPSGHPSQILGAIKAEGQVYVMNPNGVIFGANSQVNARGLTASSLPLNDNLRELGLLNNRDAQFLFSALSVPGGSDGTPDFDPFDPARIDEVPLPATPDGRFGDIVVQAGAQLSSPVSADGNGGRISLVGPNVYNDGTISTPNGQTILAAGMQVAVQAHDPADPSLRGLDVRVGSVGDYGGTLANTGLIESLTGSITLAGKDVRQLGVLESSTSVALNGRIDLSAFYGAAGNPGYDNTGSGVPTVPFLFQESGVVTFGPGSVTRILPDYASAEAVPGTGLPEVSQINVEGLAIRFETGSTVLAPNAKVGIRAGRWPYKDADGSRTTSGETNVTNLFLGGLLFDQGQVYFEPGSILDVAGSTDVFVPYTHNILTLQLLGQELADSPLQRDGEIRGVDLTVDIRNTGTYNGRYWVGTPLGDVTGFANLIERNAAQLTTAGGQVTVQAGNSVVMQPGSIVNVSGGYANVQGSPVQTSKLISGDTVIDIAKATPDRIYDGVYTGETAQISDRWGVMQTFEQASFAPEPDYLSGAQGGTLEITAPAMALDGDLVGLTVSGPRQRSSPPGLSSLRLSFAGQELYQNPVSGSPEFIAASPSPPRIEFRNGLPVQAPADPFSLVGNLPGTLRADRLAEVFLSPELTGEQGFGHLTVENPDGDIEVPAGVTVAVTALGSIELTGANLTLGGQMLAPGGALTFTALNLSPNAMAKLPPVTEAAAPSPNPDRGAFSLAPGAVLSTAGLRLNEQSGDGNALSQPLAVDGGVIAVEAYRASLAANSILDVSGGVRIDPDAAVRFGDGGSISILTGKDPQLGTVRGGSLTLGSTLLGYSGGTGGELTVQATAIQLGGSTANLDVLLLQPGFFQQGGFTCFHLTGIGAPSAVPALPGQPDNYLPGVSIAPGTVIEPLAERLRVNPLGSESTQDLLQRFLPPQYARRPVSLHFEALGSDDPFTTGVLEVRGDIVMGLGSRIATDPGATVSFDGETVTVLGSVLAPGGSIEIAAAGLFPLSPDAESSATFARPTVHIGPGARLLAEGTAVMEPDPYGRRLGTVYSGGTISVSGNILAEAGAVLDVSGTSALLDFHPADLGQIDPLEGPFSEGAVSPLWWLRSQPVQVDSEGGRIRLEGSEMLYSDATLRAPSGGPTAVGGTLSVFSGRFHPEAATQTGADINLIVTQSGLSLASTNVAPGIGRAVLDAGGLPLTGIGTFAADRFLDGGFDSLDLGSAYLASASPVPFGGNLRFEGPVHLEARGFLQLAGGGVIEAGSSVHLSAAYLRMGQAFRPPLSPNDQVIYFQRSPAVPSAEYRFAPTAGSGSVTFEAGLIDVGTLSLLNTGFLTLNAGSGDIRGNGTLNLAGALTLQAGQIYPTTLTDFNIFAYNAGAAQGSVTITGSGNPAPPLSGGGSLNVYAATIRQGGTLRAPLGSIALGWDGTGATPLDPVAGGTIAVPLTGDVTLQTGSLTSVSALGPDGRALTIPFGLSPDGLSWLDPSGVNVTIGGLPEKSITLAGNVVTTETGSVMDIRGGGDFYAYRWVRGTGGSRDLLGAASDAWSAGAEYEAGDLVTHQGQTWSARVGHSGQAPAVNEYWTRLPESFAILPADPEAVAPYAAFNTGSNASALGGDPGAVDATLQAGDRIYLEASPGLPAGYYTLLPRGYARLPGAFLVTPLDGEARAGTTTLPDGASQVSGYRDNQFQQSQTPPVQRSLFEVAPQQVVRDRVNYDDHLANVFMRDAAARLALDRIQRLPADAGALVIQGNAGLALQGGLLASQAQGGRGSAVDLSSLAAIHLIGGTGTAPVGSSAVLNTSLLNSWGVESLLIGGLRQETQDGVALEVRTSQVTLNNPGASLAASEITLVSQDDITVTAGSALASSGAMVEASQPATVEGDGTLVRVSGDADSSVARSGATASTGPLLTLGDGAQIQGASVILDSSYGTSLAPAIVLEAGALTLGSGQISVFLQDPGAPAGEVVTPHLILAGDLLAEVQMADSLTLQSYRTIDFYGAGAFGNNSLDRLSLLSGGIRGFGQGAGTASLMAGDVFFSNPSGAAMLPAPADISGALQVEGDTIRFGTDSLEVAGYQDLRLTARQAVLSESSGKLSTGGNLAIATPLITGRQGSAYEVVATGSIVLSNGLGSSNITPGLGASLSFSGSDLTVDTAIRLPSGALTLRATAGDVNVGGELTVAGAAKAFYDQIRYGDAGSIVLDAAAGNVNLLAGSQLSVAAHPGGGDAGFLTVNVPMGELSANGSLHGMAGAGGEGGSFLLDAGGLASYAAIRDDLLDGGFSNSQRFRLRSGSFTLDGTTRAADFSFSTDQGSITVAGVIDATGATGGSIALTARDDVLVQAGAVLTVAGQGFDSAGKGGDIRIEAGAQSNGVVSSTARLTLEAGSGLDLSVAEYVPGGFATVGSSAFSGQFQGELHLRAPRVGSDLGVDALEGSIHGASSVLVEGYQLYDRTAAGGLMNIALRNQVNTEAAAWMTAGETAMRTRLLAGNPDASQLAQVLVLAPGVEIIHRTGDLTLGLANPTGSTNAEARATADWDLSTFRYGANGAPGVLTLRARDDLVFNNALSDGFTSVASNTASGNSGLWLALPQAINPNLPVNTQSWSYRLTAGADLGAASHRDVLPLNGLAAGKGSVLVGELYPAVPNANTGGVSPGVGLSGLTSGTIRVSTDTTDRGTRYEVIRTGTGSIDVAAGRDVQLRNPFATIYTAGVAVPNQTTVFQSGDFVLPVIPTSNTRHPAQADLGAIQQLTQPRWTMAGGDVSIRAGANAGRYTMSGGVLTEDSTRQLPTNWLYRRGYVDPGTGAFYSHPEGLLSVSSLTRIQDTSPSTAWWVDFSNFFQGIGALGGGNVSLQAEQNIVNLDAVIPTVARMAGRDPATGANLAPDSSKLLVWGGGDLTVQSGRDLSGGIYYVERGQGRLSAGGQITTNPARSPSLGILGSTSQPLTVVQSQNPATYDPLTWMPTTLFVGDSQFEVKARGDILIGPVANTSLLPQGLNNRFWYKTYFQTFGSEAGADITSSGGSITHRMEVTLPGYTAPMPVLTAWLSTQNVYAGVAFTGNASHFQPWLRLAEIDVTMFNSMAGVNAPHLRSTAFAGDIELAGSLSLFPSPTGTLELLAQGAIHGLSPTGRSVVDGRPVTVWTSASVNVSDSDPALAPAPGAPIAYAAQPAVGRVLSANQQSNVDALSSSSEMFAESGATSGLAVSAARQRALHAPGPLHASDPEPARLYAAGGDISGFTLFSPKSARILAERDISDVALYLQNTAATDISLVAAGRDVVPFNESAGLRTLATNLRLGNLVPNTEILTTVTGSATSAQAGDIQVSGPGLLEVLAGRNLDLGTGSNFTDGTGVGITSIGNRRNPFLPFEGADIIAMAGAGGAGGSGPAQGLSGSALDFAGFVSRYISPGASLDSNYLRKLGITGPFAALTPEQQAIAALEVFYRKLREAGQAAAAGGDYEGGFEAVETLFGSQPEYGEIFSRARDIRTVSGGAVSLAAPGGGLTMAADIFGNPLAPPGIVTEYGGNVSLLTDQSVAIGQARIFTLRGGDLIIWSSKGDIAAGSAPRTVVTAPPTRVVIDSDSAAVQTDLGGLATGGGIGVLASVKGVRPGSVDLIAPSGVVDAGDAGIRATGDITIAAVQVLNASRITAGGSSVGVPSAPAPAAPNLGAASSAASASAATSSASQEVASQSQEPAGTAVQEFADSLITVEVIGYGGGGCEEDQGPQPGTRKLEEKEEDEEEKEEKKKVAAVLGAGAP